MSEDYNYPTSMLAKDKGSLQVVPTDNPGGECPTMYLDWRHDEASPHGGKFLSIGAGYDDPKPSQISERVLVAFLKDVSNQSKPGFDCRSATVTKDKSRVTVWLWVRPPIQTIKSRWISKISPFKSVFDTVTSVIELLNEPKPTLRQVRVHVECHPLLSNAAVQQLLLQRFLWRAAREIGPCACADASAIAAALRLPGRCAVQFLPSNVAWKSGAFNNEDLDDDKEPFFDSLAIADATDYVPCVDVQHVPIAARASASVTTDTWTVDRLASPFSIKMSYNGEVSDNLLNAKGGLISKLVPDRRTHTFETAVAWILPLAKRVYNSASFRYLTKLNVGVLAFSHRPSTAWEFKDGEATGPATNTPMSNSWRLSPNALAGMQGLRVEFDTQHAEATRHMDSLEAENFQRYVGTVMTGVYSAMVAAVVHNDVSSTLRSGVAILQPKSMFQLDIVVPYRVPNYASGDVPAPPPEPFTIPERNDMIREGWPDDGGTGLPGSLHPEIAPPVAEVVLPPSLPPSSPSFGLSPAVSSSSFSLSSSSEDDEGFF